MNILCVILFAKLFGRRCCPCCSPRCCRTNVTFTVTDKEYPGMPVESGTICLQGPRRCGNIRLR